MNELSVVGFVAAGFVVAEAEVVFVPKVAHSSQVQPLHPCGLCLLPLCLVSGLISDPPRHIRISIHRLLVRWIIFGLATTVAPYFRYPAALSTTMLTSPVTIHPAPKSPPHAEPFILL